jgi:methyl-accepting chemotaxis protein
MFKSMTVGKKIIFGFATVLLILVIVGVVAYRATLTSSNGFTSYREMARDTTLSGRLQANMLMVQMSVKNYFITGSDKDLKQYADYLKKMEGFMDEAQKGINNPERAALIDDADSKVQDYKAGFEKVVAFINEHNKLVTDVLNVDGSLMEKNLTDIMDSANKDYNVNVAFNSGLGMKHLLLARLYVAKFIDENSQAAADRVHMEFGKMQGFMDYLSKEMQNSERLQMLATVVEAKARVSKTFDNLVKITYDRNEVITGTLDVLGSSIADGIESVNLSIKAVQDDLGPKLVASNSRNTFIITALSIIALVIGSFLAFVITRAITKPLNLIIQGLNEGASQVASASGQVSSSSQSLAEGASEQAASIEETSSSMEEMSSMTKKNAENAGHADGLMKETNKVVAKANQSMGELTQSMEDISQASEETSKIIKTIDEIAFQTNLLALNAAVEAARAGEAGAGFAVVADEVRNLAMRASDAAKNTASLIEGTVKKVKDGSALVSTTNDAFRQVAESSSKVGDIVSEIAEASKEQSSGIEQVNIAITQMDKVVQQNAANAEESASASEEINAQAGQLKEHVEGLVGLVTGNKNHSTAVRSRHTIKTVSPSSSSRSAAKGKNKLLSDKTKEVRSDQVIPFDDDDDDDFKDF